MNQFKKTYKTDDFRIRIQISDTSDRLTIYECENNVLTINRIKYEWYFDRKNLVDNMVKDLVDVDVPFKTICEVMNDVKFNLKTIQ
jgi:hypothetical protein